MEMQIVPIESEDLRKPPTEDYGFCVTFANRMFSQRYSADEGWHDAKIGPYEPLQLDPATISLHYAQMIFEGMKAYRRPDGRINLFRPWENMRRFNNSARRMAMATVDEEDHLTAICTLIEMEKDWVPSQPDASLYIRPVMIATDTTLGVRSSKSYLHYIIISPVGPYFASGFNPISVYIADQYVRAVRGGVGDAKTGGNYAASMYVGEEARKRGYAQVLWLDAVEHRYVEEVGAMNICFVHDGKRIVTPPLTGSILPGVTRRSVIELGRHLGYEVVEEPVDVFEMLEGVKSGRVTEVFGCGTAAVIAPVGKLGYKDEEFIVNNMEPGPVATRLFKELTDIQYGRAEDPFGWTYTFAPNGHSNGK
ncbi:MAG TPA: branched-chain amino acid aminotransferase [Promineifilum sp.]